MLNNPLGMVDPLGLVTNCLPASDPNWVKISSTMNTNLQGTGCPIYGPPPQGCGFNQMYGGTVGGVNCGASINVVQQGDSGSGPAHTGFTISAVHKPVSCDTFKAIWKGLELKLKLGPELQFGPAKFGFSMYKNLSTGGTGSSFDINAGYVSFQGDNPTPDGGSFNSGGPQNIRYSASILGFQYDVASEQWSFNPSKSFHLGLQALLGAEVSFNSDAFYDECRAEGVQ